MRIIRTRLKVLYYGAFRPFLFEGRQPICIEKNKNHHKSISLRSKDFKTSGFLTGQGTKRSPYCRMDEAFNTEPAEIRLLKTGSDNSYHLILQLSIIHCLKDITHIGVIFMAFPINNAIGHFVFSFAVLIEAINMRWIVPH